MKSLRNAKHRWNPRASLTRGATSHRVASCRAAEYMGQVCTGKSCSVPFRPGYRSRAVHLHLVRPLVNVRLREGTAVSDFR